MRDKRLAAYHFLSCFHYDYSLSLCQGGACPGMGNSEQLARDW